MEQSTLARMINGEIVDLGQTLQNRKIVTVSPPVNYGLAPQTTLIKRIDGSIADLVQSIVQGKVVTVTPPVSYTLAPKSDLIRTLDGELVSFLDILLQGLNNSNNCSCEDIYNEAIDRIFDTTDIHEISTASLQLVFGSGDSSNTSYTEIDEYAEAGVNLFRTTSWTLSAGQECALQYSNNSDSDKQITGMFFEATGTLRLGQNNLPLALPVRGQYPFKLQNLHLGTKTSGEGSIIYCNGTPLIIGENFTYSNNINVVAFLSIRNDLDNTNQELNKDRTFYVHLMGSSVTNIIGGSRTGSTNTEIKKGWIRVTGNSTVTNKVYLAGENATETTKELIVDITTTGTIHELAKGTGNVEMVKGRINLDCINSFNSNLSKVYFEDVELILNDNENRQKLDTFLNIVSPESTFILPD